MGRNLLLASAEHEQSCWLCDHGSVSYRFGREDWTGAARIAGSCCLFRPDVEEEQVADEARSCYNCRYRRWTADSFVCLKGGPDRWNPQRY